MKIFLTAIASMILLLGISQPGSLDYSFGNKGKAVSSFAFNCYSLALQPDDKIIGGGYGASIKNLDTIRYLLTRYNNNGISDNTFGDSGRAAINYLPNVESLNVTGVTVQTDGKLIAAGWLTTRFPQQTDVLIARFNSNGTLDKNFGNSGTVVLDLGYFERTTGIALQEDGKIVVTGMRLKSTGSFISTFTLRFSQDGILDNSFGENGKVFTTGFGLFANVHGIKIYQNHVLIGITENISSFPEDQNSYVVLKYLQNGQVDSSYGLYGTARFTIPKEDNNNVALNDICLQPDGKVIATGGVGKDSVRLAVVRFTLKGFPDTSFGKAGYTSFIHPKTFSEGLNVFVQTDNKIIAGGLLSYNNNSFGAVRFLSNGTIDSFYGDNGAAYINILGSESDAPTCALLQPDGKMLVGGNVYPDDENLGVVQGIVRFNGGSTQKQIFITKIKKWLQHHNCFTWDANSSINSYVVQRSYDGIHFNSIAKINGSNSSNTYADPSPLTGNNYYRLQTTSRNGAINYSNVIALTTDEDAIKISPNPAKNNLQIQGLKASKKTKITVVDFSGNVKLQAVVNKTAFNLNIASLKPGNYLLKIEMNDEVITKKFVKE